MQQQCLISQICKLLNDISQNTKKNLYLFFVMSLSTFNLNYCYLHIEYYISFNQFIFKIGIKITISVFMSPKLTNQILQDSQIIKIFLNFVQAFRLQYQKVHKEISYKFYEATWMLNVGKATGYGCSQTEAYKSALKNLMELLMNDSRYIDYFTLIMSKSNKKVHEKEESSYEKGHLKTQIDDFSSGSNNNAHNHVRQRLHTESSKKSLLSGKMNHTQNLQLEQAKSKMRLLEAKLSLALQQNLVLKSRLANQENDANLVSNNKPKGTLGDVTDVIINKANRGHSLCDNSSMMKINQLNKVSVPKLNLNVLPNYHKKSEKSLNDVLLQAYELKHKNQKNTFYDQ